MKCPNCESTSYRKNGRLKGRQRYQCKDCGRQFLEPLASQLPASFLEDRGQNINTEQNGHSKTLIQQHSLDSPQGAIFTQELLQLFSSSEFLESPAFQQIIQTLQREQQAKFFSDSPISILLLDAENLNALDTEVEAFLSGLSSYPLTVKLAFANWKKTGGDTELYQRGYQMIHVPLGHDSADAQMIAMGAAISQHYCQAKEVFVCSSDWLFTYLITELQHQGFSVYRVSKKQPKKFPKVLTIEQMNTGETKSYSIPEKAEVPTPQELMDKIEALIDETHHSLEERLQKLSKINQLFELKKQLNFEQNSSPELTKKSNNLAQVKDSKQDSVLTLEASVIQTQTDLEIAIKSTLTACLNRSQREMVLISELAMEFKKVYGYTPKSLIKNLQLAGNLCKFLQKCNDFIVLKEKNIYHVGFQKSSKHGIDNPADLEKVLIDILSNLQPKYSNSFVPLEVLSQQFKFHYQVSLSKLLKELKIANKVISFIQSCDNFVVHQEKNKYHVTLKKQEKI